MSEQIEPGAPTGHPAEVAGRGFRRAGHGRDRRGGVSAAWSGCWTARRSSPRSAGSESGQSTSWPRSPARPRSTSGRAPVTTSRASPSWSDRPVGRSASSPTARMREVADERARAAGSIAEFVDGDATAAALRRHQRRRRAFGAGLPAPRRPGGGRRRGWRGCCARVAEPPSSTATGTRRSCTRRPGRHTPAARVPVQPVGQPALGSDAAEAAGGRGPGGRAGHRLDRADLPAGTGGERTDDRALLRRRGRGRDVLTEEERTTLLSGLREAGEAGWAFISVDLVRRDRPEALMMDGLERRSRRHGRCRRLPRTLESMRPVTDLERTVAPFKVVSDYQPSGDQPAAIDDLQQRIEGGEKDVVLLGATGTGKTASIAWLVERVQRPTLVMLPNKTLAAAVRQRAARAVPAQRRRVLRLVLRLLPARGLRPADGHLHREGLLDQRRGRAAAALRDQLAAHAARRDRGLDRVLHLRSRHPAGVRRPDGPPQGRRRVRP